MNFPFQSLFQILLPFPRNPVPINTHGHRLISVIKGSIQYMGPDQVRHYARTCRIGDSMKTPSEISRVQIFPLFIISEQLKIMNTKMLARICKRLPHDGKRRNLMRINSGPIEPELVIQCVEALRNLDFCIAEFSPAESTGRHDGLLHLRYAGHEVDYFVQIKKRVTEKSVPLIGASSAGQEGGHILVLTDYVNHATAESFRNHGIEFIDSAGNIFLNRPPLYVYVSGRKRKQPVERSARAFRSSGLKLIFLLIKNPEVVNWSYRNIAEASGNALGSVGEVIKDLRSMGFIRVAGKGVKRLERYSELISRWETHYAEDLRPKLIKGRFRIAGGKSIEALFESIKAIKSDNKILVGGELGASLLLKELRPEKAALHVSDELSKLSAQMRLIPDESGPVTILNTFGRANQYEAFQSEMYSLADPLLIHAEVLLGNSERLKNIANDIYQLHLLNRLSAE